MWIFHELACVWSFKTAGRAGRAAAAPPAAGILGPKWLQKVNKKCVGITHMYIHILKIYLRKKYIVLTRSTNTANNQCNTHTTKKKFFAWTLQQSKQTLPN